MLELLCRAAGTGRQEEEEILGFLSSDGSVDEVWIIFNMFILVANFSSREQYALVHYLDL